jgi:hypothetical protein
MLEGPPTKAFVREWMRRIRMDLRDMETVLRRSRHLDIEDWSDLREWAFDASAAAGKIQGAIEDEFGEI